MNRMLQTIWVLFFLLLFLFAIPCANAAPVTYTYDNTGRLTRADYGGGKSIDFTYDNAGNLIQKVITGTSRNIVDFDGDGRTDIAIYRKSNGAWWIMPSSGSSPISIAWGGDPSDIAVSSSGT